jgi:hypothetical protein
MYPFLETYSAQTLVEYKRILERDPESEEMGDFRRK